MQTPLAQQAREALNLSQQSYASPPGKVEMKSETTDVPALSNEPVTAFVSPPTSLSENLDVSNQEQPDVENVEMYGSIEGGFDGEQPAALHTPKSSSRQSSRQPRQVVDRAAPDILVTTRTNKSTVNRPSPRSATKSASAPSSMTKRPQSRPTSSHGSKKSASPSAERKTGSSSSPRAHSKQVKREHASFSELDADEESLRLIRELHEQDFGLRRRVTKV